MAKFYNKGPAIFQELVEKPNGNVSMGFRVAICDNGCGDERADTFNAGVIVKTLNRDDDIKELARWLLDQKTLRINKKRVDLLRSILEIGS